MAVFSKLNAPKPIACQARDIRGNPCGRKTVWRWGTRGKWEGFIAFCEDHDRSAYLRTNITVRAFEHALSAAQKAGVPKGKHPPSSGDPCASCGGSAGNLDCEYWSCAGCCSREGLPCEIQAHKYARIIRHGRSFVRPSSDFMLSEVAYQDEVINVDDLDVDPAPTASEMVVTVVCSHSWEASAVRGADYIILRTPLKVPLSNDMFLFAHDFTTTALKELKLRALGLHRLKVWDDDLVAYVPAFKNGCGVPIRLVDRSYEVRLEILLLGKELSLHVPLKEEELYDEREWDSLGTMRATITCTSYSKGYCTGDERVVTHTCMVPRRSLDLAKSTITLNDIRIADLRVLGLESMPTWRMDEGELREEPLTFSTPLDSIPVNTFAEGGLELTLRVHGPDYRVGTAKRVSEYKAASRSPQKARLD